MSSLAMIAVEATFVLLALLSLSAFLRHKGDGRRDVSLFFLALAIPVLHQWAEVHWGVQHGGLSAFASLAFACHPVLLLRLVNGFQAVPRLIRILAIGGLAIVFLRATLPSLAGGPVSLGLTAAYYLCMDGYAAMAFMRGAFTAGGVSRTRLRFTASGMALLGAALPIIILAGSHPVYGPWAMSATYALAAAAAVGFFVGLTPPRVLLRAWQLEELRTFLRRTGDRNASREPDGVLQELTTATLSATGGSAALVLGAPLKGRRRVRTACGVPGHALPDAWDPRGITARATAEARPVLSREPGDWNDSEKAAAAAVGAPVLLAAPLVVRDSIHGVVLVLLRSDPLFPTEDRDVVALLAEAAAVCLEQARQAEAERALTARLSATNAELEASVRYARALIDASLDPFVIVDEDGRVTDVNPAMVRLTGRSADALKGQAFASLAQDPESARDALARAFEDGSVRDGHLTFPNVEGVGVETLLNASVFTRQDGRTRGVLVVLRDLTHVRRLEREAAAKQEAAYRSERLASLGTLVAGVAHEINNPLAFIRGHMELALVDLDALGETMRDVNLPHAVDLAELTDGLREAMEGVDRIAGITQSLKCASRTGADAGQETTLARVDLVEVVRSVDRLLGGSMPSSVSMRVDLPPGPVPVLGSERELHQVVLNLARNALDALQSEGGTIHVRVARVEDLGEVVVEDDGPGIPLEARAKLFTPFFTTKRTGTGLGLALVQSIVEAHEGQITVDSEEGQGTLFRVRVPLMRETALEPVGA